MRHGAAVFGRVVLRSGATTAAGGIDPTTGAYTIGAAAGPGATIAWTEGTPGAQLRTIAAVEGVPADDGGSGGGGAVGEGRSRDEGTRGPVAGPPTRPGTERAPECRTTWLRRTGRSVRIPLLGVSAARARTCLGRPLSTRKLSGRRERWSMDGGVKLSLTRGRVTGIAIARRGMTSAPDHLAVGSTLARLRRALGAGRLDARRARWTVKLRSGTRRVVVTASLAARRGTVRSLDIRVAGTR
jgi:hypothetical protein